MREKFEKDAVCYAERYPDLLKGFCYGDVHQCALAELFQHYEKHGKKEELIWGCRVIPSLTEQERKDAICYAVRYPDLFNGFCGGDKTKCDEVEIFEHYRIHGKRSKMIWGCRDRDIVPARPLDYTVSSDEAPELHILVFETNAEKAAAMTLATQSHDAGIHFQAFGVNVKFEGFGTKWEVVQPILRDLPENSLVAIVDGRDVLLNIHKDDPTKGREVHDGFVSSFQALTAGKPGAVVMSTEGQCCVAALTFVKPGDYFDAEGNRNVRACPSGEEGCMWAGDSKKLPWEDFMHEMAKERTGLVVEDAYVNSGLVAGRPQDLLDLIRKVDLEVSEDDQAVFTDYMYNFPDLLVLDYAQQMFGNARWPKGMEGGGCPFDRSPSASATSSLEHKETNAKPLFLHGPGKFWDCLAVLAERIGHGDATILPKKTNLRQAK